MVMQLVQSPQHLVDLVRLVTHFGAEDDPELLEILSDRVANRIRSFSVKEILEATVNYARTLSPVA